MRKLTGIDRVLCGVDKGLRASAGIAQGASRPSPATQLTEGITTQADARAAARLLRVDHAGEVAAQALYEGQAVTARSAELRAQLEQAADEEADHLAWCAERLRELGDRPSRLGPLWYFGSLAFGLLAGAAGDRTSLGFLAETERQVGRHLEDHLQRLPAEDARSRAVLEQMLSDELGHARMAEEAGGSTLPPALRRLMHLVSRVMTVGAARL